MADTVEIQNVGGLRGVASEATLLELRDAMRNVGGSPNNNSQRLQDLYNRSLNESTKEQGRLTKAFNYVSNSMVGRFAKELAFGGNRVTDFSAAIFGAESSLTKLAGYLDNNIDTWRELSSVGASFNNSIFDMISSAANSGMELDSYSKMIMRNSEQMARFGGTVTNGAKFVGDFSKTFRRDLGSRFFEMGFTIEGINKSLIDFMSLESRRSSNGLKNDKKTQESAANYTLQLDKLAKLTGEERKQLADRISQQQTDAGLAARINSLQGAQQENLQSAIAFFDSQLPGVSDGFKDLMDGVAQTDLGKALESSIPGIGQYMQQVFTGEEDVGEVLATLKNRFGPALTNFASGFEKEQIDQMRMQGGVTGAIAEVLDSLYQFNQVSQLSAEEMAKEQERRNAVTSTFSKFEQAVTDLRKMFVDFFYDFAMEEGGLFDALSGLGNVVKELTSPGANGLAGLGTSILTFTKDGIGGLFGKNGYVTEAITDFTSFLKSDDFKIYVEKLKESITSVTTWFSELFDDISDKGFWNTFKERIFDLGNWIKELFLGSTVTEMTPSGPQEVRKQGLFENMADAFMQFWEGPYGKEMANKIIDFFANAFTNFWEGPTGTNLKNTIAGYFQSLLELMQNTFVNSWLARNILGIDRTEVAENQANEETITQGAGENIGTVIDKLLQKNADRFLGLGGLAEDLRSGLSSTQIDSLLKGIEENQSSFVRAIRPEGSEFRGELRRLTAKADEGTASQDELEIIRQVYKILNNEGYSSPKFANGTNGFQNFGSGTMAMLHNSEAVVPRNTAAGDLLQSFYDFQNKKVATVTSTPMASDSQSSLIKKVEELNTTMIKVAELLQSSVGLQAKTVKGVKGLGSDYYRGINR